MSDPRARALQAALELARLRPAEQVPSPQELTDWARLFEAYLTGSAQE